MEKKNLNKGITLVSLVITIIVMLILAGVTINMAINSDGLFGKANEAVEKFNTVVREESNEVGELTETLDQITGITWADNGNGTFTSTTGVTVEIGQYVNYNPGTHTHTPNAANGIGTALNGGSPTEGYTLSAEEVTTETGLTWRVLGVSSKGRLELISSDITTQKLYIANDKGYIHLEDNLNNFCNDLYGQGDFVSGARSLNVEDINKITRYSPSGTYGRIYQYRYNYTESTEDTDYMQYRYSTDKGATWTDWKNITSTSYQTYKSIGDNEAIGASNYADPEGNPIIKQAVNTNYTYDIDAELKEEDGYSASKVTEILNMIQMKSQWLATPMVSPTTTATGYYVPYIYKRKFMTNTYLSVGSVQMWDTSGKCYNNNGGSMAVRPVVYLAYDVTLTGEGNDIGTVNNKWTLERVVK